METGKVLEWIQNPALIGAPEVESLHQVLEDFPYFSVARMLELKGLQNTGSFRYNGQLKKTAAYVPNRSVLFEYVTEFEERKPFTSKEEKNPATLESYLEASIEEEAIEEAIREEGDAEPVLGKPLVFDKSEQHSFSEWLKLTVANPIVREEAAPEATVSVDVNKEKDYRTESVQVQDPQKEPTQERKKLSRQELIDRFIQESPKMSAPQKHALKSAPTFSSHQEDDRLMTETLARVYAEQGLYTKAIKAYRILSLKYPEKSSYFADRINEIEDLKERN